MFNNPVRGKILRLAEEGALIVCGFVRKRNINALYYAFYCLMILHTADITVVAVQLCSVLEPPTRLHLTADKTITHLILKREVSLCCSDH